MSCEKQRAKDLLEWLDEVDQRMPEEPKGDKPMSYEADREAQDEEMDGYRNPLDIRDETPRCREAKGIPCAKGCPHGCADPLGPSQPPHDEKPSAECEMLREEVERLRRGWTDCITTCLIEYAHAEALVESRDSWTRKWKIQEDRARNAELALSDARALLERAMWVIAETDAEDFRAEIEEFILKVPQIR